MGNRLLTCNSANQRSEGERDGEVERGDLQADAEGHGVNRVRLAGARGALGRPGETGEVVDEEVELAVDHEDLYAQGLAARPAVVGEAGGEGSLLGCDKDAAQRAQLGEAVGDWTGAARGEGIGKSGMDGGDGG